MNYSEQHTPPDVAYQNHLRDGEFRLQRCTACGQHVFYPRTLCPHCGSGSLEWRRVSGAGEVYSSTTVRQKAERGGDYNLSLIDLDEGVRMLSRVIGAPAGEIRIGMRVRAEITQVDDKRAVVFRLAGGAA